jgi:hypothetical protein
MIIKYKSTLEDAINTNEKLFMSLNVTKRNKLIGLIGAPIFFILVYSLEDDKAFWIRIFFAFFIALTYIVLYFMFYRKSYRHNIKTYIVESRGTEEAIDAEYELTQEQLIYREGGQCIGFDWNTVVDLQNNGESIEIRFKNKGIAILRNKIFKNNEQKKEWENFIHDRIKFSTI